jgi:hypothetical protein
VRYFVFSLYSNTEGNHLCSLGGDLALEDAKFQAYLEQNGWIGHVGAAESVDKLVQEEKAGEKEGL